MSQNAKRLLVAGGDLRQLTAAESLSTSGQVTVTGFDRFGALPDCLTAAEHIQDLPHMLDALILPMPVTQDGCFLYTPCAAAAGPAGGDRPRRQAYGTDPHTDRIGGAACRGLRCGGDFRAAQCCPDGRGCDSDCNAGAAGRSARPALPDSRCRKSQPCAPNKTACARYSGHGCCKAVYRPCADRRRKAETL